MFDLWNVRESGQLFVKESIKEREKMYWKVGSGKEGERRKVKQRINQGKERKQKG